MKNSRESYLVKHLSIFAWYGPLVSSDTIAGKYLASCFMQKMNCWIGPMQEDTSSATDMDNAAIKT